MLAAIALKAVLDAAIAAIAVWDDATAVIAVWDEATAAMDTQTERNIQNAIQQLRKGKTIIAIAHRLSTLRDADSLAVIDDGRLSEKGTHRELLDLRGVYYNLHRIQLDSLKFINQD